MESVNLNQVNSGTAEYFVSQIAQDDLARTEMQKANTDWHLYRLEVSGSQLRWFVDGSLILSAQDHAFASGGQVGLRCLAGAQISVSSFIVKAL